LESTAKTRPRPNTGSNPVGATTIGRVIDFWLCQGIPCDQPIDREGSSQATKAAMEATATTAVRFVDWAWAAGGVIDVPTTRTKVDQVS